MMTGDEFKASAIKLFGGSRSYISLGDSAMPVIGFLNAGTTQG
jgi:hypothetical protein